MNRKDFIVQCSLACAGGGLLSTWLQGCTSARIVSASIIDADLVFPATEFEYLKKDQVRYRRYVVVQNEKLEYPVCVYRLNDTSYTALWMKCTHQGTELQAFGDKLHCPAHGSEFNTHGGVENGPAADSLRSFAVVVSEGQLKISLK